MNGKDVANKEQTENLFAETKNAVTILVSRCLYQVKISLLPLLPLERSNPRNLFRTNTDLIRIPSVPGRRLRGEARVPSGKWDDDIDTPSSNDFTIFTIFAIFTIFLPFFLPFLPFYFSGLAVALPGPHTLLSEQFDRATDPATATADGGAGQRQGRGGGVYVEAPRPWSHPLVHVFLPDLAKGRQERRVAGASRRGSRARQTGLGARGDHQGLLEEDGGTVRARAIADGGFWAGGWGRGRRERRGRGRDDPLLLLLLSLGQAGGGVLESRVERNGAHIRDDTGVG